MMLQDLHQTVAILMGGGQLSQHHGGVISARACLIYNKNRWIGGSVFIPQGSNKQRFSETCAQECSELMQDFSFTRSVRNGS